MKFLLFINLFVISTVIFHTCESATLYKRDAKEDAELSVIKAVDVVAKLREKGLVNLATQLETDANTLKDLLAQLKAATVAADVQKFLEAVKSSTASLDQTTQQYQTYLHC